MKTSCSLIGAILVWACGPAMVSAPAHAEPSTRDCSKAGMRKARDAADKSVKAKDVKAAIAALEPFLRECKERDATEAAWLAADLAVAYERDGQALECARLMAPLAHPSSGLPASAPAKLTKAVRHNLDHCSKALDTQYAAIKAGGCTLTVERSIATAAAPSALVPKGASAACVALVRGARPAGNEADDDVVCPKVALIWKSAKPALERQELTSTDGALGDDAVCCNLSSIAAGTKDGKTLIRLRGHGRDCNGGTADTASDVFYEWRGTALTAPIDASVSFH